MANSLTSFLLFQIIVGVIFACDETNFKVNSTHFVLMVSGTLGVTDITKNVSKNLN